MSKVIVVTASKPSIAKQLKRIAAKYLAVEVRCVEVQDLPGLDADGVFSYCRSPAEIREILPAQWSFATRPSNKLSPCGTLFACPEAVRMTLPVTHEEVGHFGFGIFSQNNLATAMNFLSNGLECGRLRNALHKPFWLLELELMNKWHGRFVRRHFTEVGGILPKLSDLTAREALEKSMQLLAADYRDLMRTLYGTNHD